MWDNYWDTTAISHVLHLHDHDESYEEAAYRSMQSEMGIAELPLKKIGGFNYFATYGKSCENEYCAILFGTYNGPVIPNKNAVYEYQWMNKKKFIQECLGNNKQYTPWAILTGKFLASKNSS